MKIVEFSFERPVTTLMMLVSLTVLGAVAIARIPLDFMPLVAEPEIDIEVPFPGGHPLELIQQVVQPIEEEVATIPGLKGIISNASAGQAYIEASFNWTADVDVKKMEVREAVERARPRLPAGVGFIRVQGDVGGPGDGGGAILQGRISAERNLSESWDLLDRCIRRPLERIRGVARVSLYGVEAQQVRVDLDLEALRQHGIAPRQVLEVIDGANVDLDLGALRGDVLRYDVRSVARFTSVDEIRDLVLTPTGPRVRDVAQVTLTEPRLNYGRHLDRRFAIGIDVLKEPTANTVETVDRLMERIDEIEHDPELAGIKLLVWINQGEQIRKSLGGLFHNGIVGGLLAAGVLYAFLRRWRTTLIISVAIPFSIVATCAGMYVLGYDFNVLTMLGLMIGVGMLVDNAVVVIENIHRLEGLGLPPTEAARRGAREVALAVTASTATSIIVWSWLFVAERGHMTIYMGAVAFTICLAVACSLLISLTFIPLAASRFGSSRALDPGFMLTRVVPTYRRFLGWTLRHRLATLGGLLALAATAIYPGYMIEKEGEPRTKERAVGIFYQIHDQLTKDAMEAHVNTIESWLESRKAELGFDSLYSWFSENEGAMTQVYLDPDHTDEAAIKKLRAGIQSGLPVIAGVKLEVGDRMWWRGGDRGRRMVAVALHGEDPEFLQTLAARLEERLKGVLGSLEVFGPSLQGQKEVRVVVDAEKARSYGVTPRAVAETVGFTFRGQRLRRFERPSGEVEVLLALPEDRQPGLAALADLAIPRGADGFVPLSAVAEIVVQRTPPNIQRQDRKTTTWVSVQFDEKVPTHIAQERVKARMAGFHLPEGYIWDWGEWGRRRDESLGVMLKGILLSLLLVILLMAAIFESMLQPLAIIITLPLAFFGAFWSLWLGGYSLDIVAFIGVIILIGIVVSNGIVMVDHVNTLRRGGADRIAALIEGCGDRLRPVVMTAITTIIGLMPMAFSAFTVADAYVDSMAVVVLGGLLTSTLFTLIALPVWYTTVEDAGAVLRRMLPRRAERAGSPAPATSHRGVLAGQ